MVVPAEEVRKALAGRVGAVVGTRLEGPKGTADLEIKAQVVDPKGMVQSVVVHVAPASSAGTISPNSDGSWPPLPNTKAVELQKDDKTSSVSGRVQVTLSGEGAAARKVLIQTAHRDRRGQLVYSKPREYELPEKGSFGHAGRLQKMMKMAQRRSVNMLGPLIDPDKDCKLTKDEDNLKIKIEIPGKLHTLSPEITSRKNRKVSLHNAPMTLTEVEGDFAALVEVTGEINPGSATPKDRQGHAIPFTVQSAGLILVSRQRQFPQTGTGWQYHQRQPHAGPPPDHRGSEGGKAGDEPHLPRCAREGYPSDPGQAQRARAVYVQPGWRPNGRCFPGVCSGFACEGEDRPHRRQCLRQAVQRQRSKNSPC